LFGVKIDAVRQRIALHKAQHHGGFLHGFAFINGLAVEVDAYLNAGGRGALNVAAEGGILNQCAGTIAAVPAADDRKGDAVGRNCVPIDCALELRNVDATGFLAQHTGRAEGVDVTLNHLGTGHGLVGSGVVIICIAVNRLPAGADCHRLDLAFHRKPVAGQVGGRNVVRPAGGRVGGGGGGRAWRWGFGRRRGGAGCRRRGGRGRRGRGFGWGRGRLRRGGRRFGRRRGGRRRGFGGGLGYGNRLHGVGGNRGVGVRHGL